MTLMLPLIHTLMMWVHQHTGDVMNSIQSAKQLPQQSCKEMAVSSENVVRGKCEVQGVQQVERRSDYSSQPGDEDVQDLSAMAEYNWRVDVDMPQWCKTDPVEGEGEAMPQAFESYPDPRAVDPTFFRLENEMEAHTLERHAAMLHEGLALIQNLQDPQYTAEKEFQQESDQTWLNRMLSYAPDPSAFTAGRMHACVSVLQEYLESQGKKSRVATNVIKQFREGVKFKFVGTEHPSQAKAPQRRQKMEAVRSMLGKAVGKESVDEYLTGNTPHPIQFPNHRSVREYEDYVAAELEACMLKGVVKEWKFDKPPRVRCGLKVVDDKLPKLRLCVNPLYINMFMEYEPVKYEKLQDVVDMAEQGDYLISSDDKSGYWQMPLHPDMWEYLGSHFRGKDYVWCALPFGPAQACGTFTTYKQEFYKPLRQMGVRLSMLLDDRLAMESSRPRARVLSEALTLISVAVGSTLNLPDIEGKKAQWLPVQQCRFLGFKVDTASQKFVLPEEKKQDLLESIYALQGTDKVNNRQLAQVAGKLIAASPALQLAPLFARAVYQAMVGTSSWDALYPNQEALQADLQCCAESLLTSNGHAWFKRQATFVVAGDASDFAFAAYAPNGEYSHPIVVSFTQEQLDLMAANQFSSTLREIICVLETCNVLLQQVPHLVFHKRLIYETDSQTGFYSVMGMKGNQSTFPVVKQLRLLCSYHDIELDMSWSPRTEQHQRMADFWSKVEDNSEWSLNNQVYDELILDPILQGYKPTIDVFASHTTTKVSQCFYSKYACPGTSGVDAFVHPWARERSGAVHLAYINGPFDKMGAIVRKIKDEKVSCILVGPVWPRHWLAMLQKLPIRKSVVLSGRQDLCIPGPHVPKPKRKPRHPKYRMQAWYILW